MFSPLLILTLEVLKMDNANEGCVVGRGYLKRLEAERDTLKEQVDIWRKGCEKALSVCKEREEIIEKHIEYDLSLMTQRNKAEAERDTLRGERDQARQSKANLIGHYEDVLAQRDTLRGALQTMVSGYEGYHTRYLPPAYLAEARAALAQGGDE